MSCASGRSRRDPRRGTRVRGVFAWESVVPDARVDSVRARGRALSIWDASSNLPRLCS